MADFNQTVGSLFKGMDAFLSTKTVVGEPTKIGDTIILPLVDVNFGVAAGAFTKEGNKNSAGGGMGGKMSPSAVLVIQNGRAKMISVKNTDTVSKIMDMIPEIMDKITSLVKKGEIDDQEAAIEEAISDIAKDEYMS
ncbi:MAG: GerW family sporulation protein [Clostridium sp.]|nr:GerW family sporulation protein [Clostridium sp.]MCM1170688.1 GerW family sporulation protein [Clostridium sp.]MCM1208366.1 GerW family sporulation protein [Ruminococcus sp.]